MTMYFIDAFIDYKLVETMQTTKESELASIKTELFNKHSHKKGFFMMKKRKETEYEVVSECPDGVCPVRTRVKPDEEEQDFS